MKKEEDEKEKKSLKSNIFEWVQSIVVSVIIVTLVVTFIGRPCSVRGSSMLPTFSDGDKIIATNIHGDFKYGDVVVIKRKDDIPLIKRIIAVEDEIVNINFETGEVTVNGVLLNEPYINETTRLNYGTVFPAQVPKGCVFVMGDNRNHSDDSRNPKVGMINTKNIFGKVVFRIFPFDQIGPIKFENK